MIFNNNSPYTTEWSVASTFCQDSGIILKFESSESSKYIRTLDMGLFSCFDHEREHLIFETRLHIKDIFVTKEGAWIGYKWMRMLSLYDLLVHGSVVHNKYLLKAKNQKRLHKQLKLIYHLHRSGTEVPRDEAPNGHKHGTKLSNT